MPQKLFMDLWASLGHALKATRLFNLQHQCLFKPILRVSLVLQQNMLCPKLLHALFGKPVPHEPCSLTISKCLF